MTIAIKPRPNNYAVKDEMIRQSILNPIIFTKAWLQVELWARQQEILLDIFHNSKVAVKSCHASGKTFIAACAALAFLAKFQKSVVITTAPTARQVNDVLWKQIRYLASTGRYPFPESNQASLTISPSRYAVGFTTSLNQGDATKFQGYHSEHILVIADEAAGVEAALFGAIEGILSTGDSHLLLLGNPTVASGTFYDCFAGNRSTWKTHTISAFSTPNFVGLKHVYRDVEGKEVLVGDPDGRDITTLSQAELDKNECPYLISRRWFVERLEEWGPTHPLFISRCLGQFPSQSPDALMNIGWLEKAQQQTVSYKENEKFCAGVDVAGPGEDETVLCVRRGGQIVRIVAWPQPDPRGELLIELREYEGRLEYVNVDSCGIGFYLARHLEDAGLPVSDVNVGESADNKSRYVNLKAEAYWGLRMWFAAGDVGGVLDDISLGQLASIRYKPNSRGQICIESKEDAAKRGVASPDRAEAIMLAFARPRLHGLISYWEQLSDELASKKTIPPTISPPSYITPPTPRISDSESLAEVQKRMGYKESVLSNHNPDKTMKGRIQVYVHPDHCPGCGNSRLSIYAEGAWGCGVCGTKGIENTSVVLGPGARAGVLV